MNNILGIRRFSALIFFITALSLTPGCAPIPQNDVNSSAVPPDENVLRVGITANLPPLIYKQGNKIVGMEADFAKELAEYLNKSLRFVELDWDDQIPALLDNRIDIIMSGMSITALREVRIAFSLSYFESGQMALIRRTDAARYATGFFSFSNDATVGAIKDTTGAYFIETNFGKINKKMYSDSRTVVKDLLNKKIDMFIHDAPMVLYLASENETKGLTVIFALLTKEPLAWGVRKDDVELLESVNTFLRTIKEEGKLTKIIKYWIPFTR